MRQHWPETLPNQPVLARALRLIRRHPIPCLLWLVALLIPVWWWLSSGESELRPNWACAQPIPRSNQSLFLVRFESEWAFTDEHWSYAISDSANRLSVEDLQQMPQGRAFKITHDGTVHVASFAPYDPKLGEQTSRRVIHGVPVIATIFNAENSSWQSASYTFERVETDGDRIDFIAVNDGMGKPIHDRVSVELGGIVATDKDGMIRYLEVYRVEPDPSNSPVGTRRQLLYETYTPRAGVSIRSDQIPWRGICKPTRIGKRHDP